MDAKAARRRWFWPTPAWLVWGAAIATGVLFACERWRWFPSPYQKGWPALLAVGLMAAVLLLTLIWMLEAALFRRRVQFGLRTLLVFVTLCAMVCSWLAVRIEHARRQAEAVAALEIHFEVSYEWHWAQAVPPEAEPLRKLLGADFFMDVKQLFQNRGYLNDADLADVAVLKRLKWLTVRHGEFTDAGLSRLEGLTNLEDLSLEDTKVTKEGVKKLRHALPQCNIDVLRGGQ